LPCTCEIHGTGSIEYGAAIAKIRSTEVSNIAQTPHPPGVRNSLTLYIQNKSPGADKEANWLPAPNGPIYLVTRLYWPKTEPPSILPAGQGTWQPPGIKRVS
jgi:hypothetical protein